MVQPITTTRAADRLALSRPCGTLGEDPCRAAHVLWKTELTRHLPPGKRDGRAPTRRKPAWRARSATCSAVYSDIAPARRCRLPYCVALTGEAPADGSADGPADGSADGSWVTTEQAPAGDSHSCTRRNSASGSTYSS